MPSHEYEVGLHKYDLDTPALLIDLPAMEKNLRVMAEFFKGTGVNLRPHVKLHKATPILARMQVEAGGVGLTCAKLSEAELLAASGFKDILIANEIAGQRKIERLVNLAAYTDVMVAVDNYQNLKQLSEAAQARGVELRVLVEVNIGHDRCGVDPFQPALDLSRAVHEAPGLKYAGLMGYDGHCTLRVTAAEREECARQANRLLVETRRFIEDAGLEVGIVSASGTFTYRYASQIEGITEIQAGTYLFSDTAFRDAGVEEFDCALTVLATVSSRPGWVGGEDLAILDIGRKTIDTFLGLPEVKCPEGATLIGLSQEHGRMKVTGPARSLRPGDKVEVWVRDANGTINLYDHFYAIRDDIVEAVWDIPGRGRST